jgi:hypothetical protein
MKWAYKIDIVSFFKQELSTTTTKNNKNNNNDDDNNTSQGLSSRGMDSVLHKLLVCRDSVLNQFQTKNERGFIELISACSS